MGSEADLNFYSAVFLNMLIRMSPIGLPPAIGKIEVHEQRSLQNIPQPLHHKRQRYVGGDLEEQHNTGFTSTTPGARKITSRLLSIMPRPTSSVEEHNRIIRNIVASTNDAVGDLQRQVMAESLPQQRYTECGGDKQRSDAKEVETADDDE